MLPARLLICGVAWLTIARLAVAEHGETPPRALRLPATISEGVPVGQGVMTLADVEMLALANHPAIAAGIAQVRAARCECYQAGLPPNPTAGYTAGEIGGEGTAGQQGMYLGQRFVRGGKLSLDQAVLCQKVRRLEQELAAQQQRVLTNVRTLFYETAIAQRQVEITQRLLDVSTQAATAVEQLLAAQEARKTDVLQAQIERQRAKVQLQQAGFGLEGAWRQLAAAVGQAGLAQRPVEADIASIDWAPGWDETRAALLSGSPEVSAAVAEINRARAAWRRECAEPVPDVTAQVAVQYSDSTQDTITSVQVGMPLPIWNRNQGGIGKACHEITVAKRKLESLELRLTKQLAVHLQQYQAAKAKADAYRDGILKPADQTLSLVHQAYAAGEASYLDLLTAQRTYFGANLEYLAAQREVNASVQLLAGYLLGDDGG